jgi:hypothetical protein
MLGGLLKRRANTRKRRELLEGEGVWQERTVAEMAVDVLAHQAKSLVYRTGQPFEDALVVILKTDSGHRLTDLADGPHRLERARDWWANLTGAEERHRTWLEDYKECLEDEEAHAEHWAFLQQALGVRTSPAVEQ